MQHLPLWSKNFSGRACRDSPVYCSRVPPDYVDHRGQHGWSLMRKRFEFARNRDVRPRRPPYRTPLLLLARDNARQSSGATPVASHHPQKRSPDRRPRVPLVPAPFGGRHRARRRRKDGPVGLSAPIRRPMSAGIPALGPGVCTAVCALPRLDPRGWKNAQKLHIFSPLRCKVAGEWGGSAHYPDPTAQSVLTALRKYARAPTPPRQPAEAAQGAARWAGGAPPLVLRRLGTPQGKLAPCGAHSRDSDSRPRRRAG